MEFCVGTRREPDRTAIPRRLRPLPEWVAAASAEPSHVWRFTMSGGLRPRWLINGRSFDPAHVEATAKLGEMVTRELRNDTAVAHLIHLHHTDW